jgi:DHA1 family tetracycline resistance protein-like MFS transporter
MNRSLLRVSLSLFTWGIGEGMFFIFQPIYLQQWGASPVLIGALLGAVGITMAVAQIPAGYLADRFGGRTLMQVAWVLGLIATLIMGFAPVLPVFIAGMLIYGLTAFVSTPMNSYVASSRGNWSVARALTQVGASFQLGMMLGPALGGILGQQLGLQAIYRIAAIFFVISTVIIFTIHPQPVEPSRETGGNGKLHTNTRFIGFVVLSFLTVFAAYLPQPLTPNYLQNIHHLSLVTIGQFGSISSLGNVLFALTLGNLNPTAGFMVGQMLVGLFALIMWQGDSSLWFILGYFLLGGYRLLRSMTLAHSSSLVNTSETGLAFGVVETGNAFAVILAPAAAGILYAHNPLSVFTTGLILISVVFCVNLIFMIGKAKIFQRFRTLLRLEEKP